MECYMAVLTKWESTHDLLCHEMQAAHKAESTGWPHLFRVCSHSFSLSLSLPLYPSLLPKCTHTYVFKSDLNFSFMFLCFSNFPQWVYVSFMTRHKNFYWKEGRNSTLHCHRREQGQRHTKTSVLGSPVVSTIDLYLSSRKYDSGVFQNTFPGWPNPTMNVFSSTIITTILIIVFIKHLPCGWQYSIFTFILIYFLQWFQGNYYYPSFTDEEWDTEIR